MQKPKRHILRSDEVTLEGRVQLDLMQGEPGQPRQGSPASTTQQVRIVEDHPDFAVLEVTCCCGATTYVRCEYAGAESLVADSAGVQQ